MIGGIKQTMDTEKKQAQDTIGSAFSDMASLREKARDLSALAQQLKSYEEETKDEELREIRGVMSTLGFTTGVTEETAGKNFHQQLARELCDFVYPHCEAAGGLISLYDVYCLYNRSRPSDMISPTDLLNACKLMQKLSMPLVLHEFKSGIKTLQISVRSDAQIMERVMGMIRSNEHLSVVQLSSLMNVSPIVAKQYLLIGEDRGLLCRDDSVEGLHFYENRLVRS
jgi:ESCRT-II complex subunit VPS36